MPKALAHVLLLALAAGAVFFTNLGAARLWDRDEPRNAGCAWEMMQRGDWVVPVFNAELRTHKPVLLYWFIMSAYAVFEDREFGARFWSAMLGVGTVLMTYAIGRRLFNAAAGLWAGLVLCSSMSFGIAARIATPDSVLIFFVTAAVLVFVYGVFGPRGVTDRGDNELLLAPEPREAGRWFPRWPLAALMYALMGAAVLAKGPVGLILPTAVIGMFLLIVRRQSAFEPFIEGTLGADEPSRAKSETQLLDYAVPVRPAARGRWGRRLAALVRPFEPRHFLRTTWSMRPITAIVVAAIVALPWYWLVWQQTDGEWVRGFLFEHNLGRATQAMEGHGGSLLMYPVSVLTYYPIAILMGFFPWSILIVPIVIDVVRRLRRGDPWRLGYVLAACWVGVFVGIFSIARTKLPSYIAPMYPGAALIAGAFMYQWSRGLARALDKSVTDALRLMPVIALVLGIGASVGASMLFAGGDRWLGAFAVVPLVGGIWAYSLARRGYPLGAARAFALTAVLTVISILGFGAVRLDSHQQSDRLLTAARAKSARPDIATFRRLEPSWVFYAGQTLEGFKSVPETCEFLRRPDAFIITSNEHIAALEPSLPPGVRVLETVPYFGRTKQTLVLLGQDDANDPSVGAQ